MISASVMMESKTVMFISPKVGKSDEKIYVDKDLATAQLILELIHGEASGDEQGWLSEKTVFKNLGIVL